MSVKITRTKQDVESVRIELRTTDRRRFFLEVSESGLEFYSDINSAENYLNEVPVVKSPDDCFDWIKGVKVGSGGNAKKFGDKKGVQPRLPQGSEGVPPRTPKFGR